MSKPILCLDFDGVIHQYASEWRGDTTIILDYATEGFFEWAEQANQYFDLVIYSSLSKNPDAIYAMQMWLQGQRKLWIEKGGKHEIDAPLKFKFSSEKPPAFLTIDDRALTFDGNWKNYDPKELINFKPWNKK